MNKEFQKEFLESDIYEPYYDGFMKSERFRSERHDCVGNALLKFCKEHNNSEIVILSKWCKGIPGMKFEAVHKSLSVLKLKTHVFPFRDENYLKPIGNFRDILISKEDLKQIIAFFEVSRKDNKQAFSNNVLFSLYNYENYIIDRKKKRAIEQARNDDYFDDIRFDEKSFFTKEYISTHKYAADFLQTFVKKKQDEYNRC